MCRVWDGGGGGQGWGLLGGREGMSQQDKDEQVRSTTPGHVTSGVCHMTL